MATGGWSGLWNRVGNEQHSLLIPRGHIAARRVANVVKHLGGTLASERVFTNLDEDKKQVVPQAVPGNPVVNGGMIPIAVNQLTPVPSANFISYVEKQNKPTTYPIDPSGNGGGGKLGVHL